jgi:hypothetical protein
VGQEDAPGDNDGQARSRGAVTCPKLRMVRSHHSVKVGGKTYTVVACEWLLFGLYRFPFSPNSLLPIHKFCVNSQFLTDSDMS